MDSQSRHLERSVIAYILMYTYFIGGFVFFHEMDAPPSHRYNRGVWSRRDKIHGYSFNPQVARDFV